MLVNLTKSSIMWIIFLFSENLWCLGTLDQCAANLTAWSKPHYEYQTRALGYNAREFRPAGPAKEIVSFWKKIYSKYSTQQGVIHHSEYPELVYEVIDFANINSDLNLNEVQKEELRNRQIKAAKERISFSLKKLAMSRNSDSLNSYDRRIINLFEKISNPPNYFESSDMNRIRFQLGQSDRMLEAIQKSGRYLPMMEKIFKEENLPKELTRIVFVESSFNVNSYSKVGASGLWQIMPSVARGRLKMNEHVDYRNHPMEATRLAAKILRQNYLALGSWPLAITAYNHGVNGVRRLVDLNKTKDLFQIIDEGTYTASFGFASRNFYYSFLAALEVEKNANEYFDDPCRYPKMDLVEARLRKPLKYKKFLELFNGDSNLAYSLNPHFQRNIYQNRTLIPQKSKVIIPEKSKRHLLVSMVSSVH